MDNDNLYPSGGYLPTEPAEQKQERESEKAKTFEALPVIEAILAHFDKRIADRDSIKTISVDISENPELHQKTCAVNDMMADALREERGLLVDMLDEVQ